MTQIKSLVDAIDSFIKGTKADGDWDAIKASCIMAGWDGLAGCLTPLKGTAPTNVGPFVTGDYSRTTGLKGNGSTKYLNSNRNNNADPQDDQHISVWLNAAQAGSANVNYIGTGGVVLGSSRIGTNNSNTTAGFRSRTSAPTSISATGASSSNFVGKSRSAGASFTARLNGGNQTLTEGSNTPLAGNIYVFTSNDSGDPQAPTDTRLAFYSIGESLNLENLDTRVSTLMTAIGAALS